MIYTVTLNPSIDFIVEVEDFKLNGLNRMTRDLKLPGGKGINVSRVLNRLGTDNTAVGFIGGFTGCYVEDCLKAESVRTGFVKVQQDTRINIKLKHGEETEINGLGPAIREEDALQLLRQLEGVGVGDVLVLSGSVPPSLGEDFYDRLIEGCQRKGAEFVIDTTGAALRNALKHKPLLIKPNHHELAELFGVTLKDKTEVAAYGRKLLELGAQHVLVSMAGEGALLLTETETYEANVPAGRVRNSVGAGDSMIAGFISAWTEGKGLLEAFRTGVAAGSATAFSDDLATGEYIRELRSQVHLTKWN
ncbi:1-phosphofructokinase [Paenibacillus yonginensis]|uniref:Tagatose-6-phosphate kinase n=1 Tax=Paenibacillus yonginensis TaxID=1462996 RepID=A0A1B1MXA0_9BACL|nr:1-phosphofructokinase [Paenibacillus yonginensis]ANS73800.1 1-phosphofructokinase [Paenibacillus yonginensis]